MHQPMNTRIIGIFIKNFILTKEDAIDGFPRNVPSIYYFYHFTNNDGEKEESSKQILYIDPSSKEKDPLLAIPTVKFKTNIAASGNILTDSDINCSEITATTKLIVGNNKTSIQIEPTKITSSITNRFFY